MPEELPAPDPTIILHLIEAFRRSKTMFTAVSLGAFDVLESRPATAATLAGALGVNCDALERLLDACVGLQLLSRQGDLYVNTPTASTYLCVQSASRMTGYIKYSDDVLWKMWGNLADAIKEGTNRWQQTFGWDGPIFSNFFRTPEAMREFVMGMHGQGLVSSPQVVAAFDLSRYRRLVDLGGATGHLAIAACMRYPDLQAVVFDQPQTVELAHEVVGESSVSDRIEVVAGDFFTDDLPDGDLYALGRIIHDWGEPKILTLLGRLFERLPSGGALLIAEKLLNEEKNGPPWAQMQNLGMLLYTEGKERTLAEYKSLLERVGFSSVRGIVTPSPLDVILAVKRDL
ncbi:MAG: methyltransferase [Isosphaeraceae bacterium]